MTSTLSKSVSLSIRRGIFTPDGKNVVLGVGTVIEHDASAVTVVDRCKDD